MSETTEDRPAEVLTTAKRTGDTPLSWSWVEPSVWTERMLTALEQGVKGGKWFSLIDKVHPMRTLAEAFAQVARNKGAAGVDHVTIAMFEAHLNTNLKNVSEELRTGTYQPQPIRRHYIPKPGSQEKRPLGIPTVRDRVVQTSLRYVLEPIFERDFADQSYGFRPGRGCKDALKVVNDLLDAGYTHVVDVDLKSYFDTIPHDGLMALLSQKISDGRILSLIRSFLKQDIMSDLEVWTPETGSPQGAVISPLLSNIYLDPLDHLMAASGYKMVRYADDFVILCRSAEEAQSALAMVQEWTAAAGLTLHPTKTRIVDAYVDGFDFLGYTFWNGIRRPRKKSLQKFKATIREQTPRNSGRSLSRIITSLNPILRGWLAYFQESHHRIIRTLDQMIRRRLRAILLRREKKRSFGRGWANRKWPNAFFKEHGLYSLKIAHDLARQSLPR